MPPDLQEAVQGELRPALEALRDLIAKELDNGVACKACGGVVSSPTAPLAKQLRDTLAALKSLPSAKASVNDDLKAKRAARQASVAKRAARGDVDRAGGDRTSS